MMRDHRSCLVREPLRRHCCGPEKMRRWLRASEVGKHGGVADSGDLGDVASLRRSGCLDVVEVGSGHRVALRSDVRSHHCVAVVARGTRGQRATTTMKKRKGGRREAEESDAEEEEEDLRRCCQEERTSAEEALLMMMMMMVVVVVGRWEAGHAKELRKMMLVVVVVVGDSRESEEGGMAWIGVTTTTTRRRRGQVQRKRRRLRLDCWVALASPVPATETPSWARLAMDTP